MGATFSFCSSASFATRFDCCKGRQSKTQEQQEHRAKDHDAFAIKPLQVVDPSYLFQDVEDIVISMTIANEGKILSVAKSNYDNTSTLVSDAPGSLSVEELEKIFPPKLAGLIRRIFRQTVKTLEGSGCLVQYENYNYHLCSVPVIDKGNLLCVLIVKKIHFSL